MAAGIRLSVLQQVPALAGAGTAVSLARGNRSRNLSQTGSDVVLFSESATGVGCSNWADLFIKNITVDSAQECGQKCSDTACCVGFGFQLEGECIRAESGGWGAGACLLWRGQCEKEVNDCFDNYQSPLLAKTRCQKKMGDNYVVAIIHADRKGQLPMLVEYLDDLVNDCHLDEVHIWDFSSDVRDSQWFQETVNKRLAYQHIPKLDLNDRYSAYAYYTQVDGPGPKFVPRWEGAISDRTVLVKIDQNILHVDTSKFAAFTEYVISIGTDHLITHANVVDSAVTSFYQATQIQRLGQLRPELLNYHEEAYKDGDFSLGLKADVSADLHRDFLAHPSDYAWEKPDKCIQYGQQGLQGQGRHPLLFFGATWRMFHMVEWLLSRDDAYSEGGVMKEEWVLTAMATSVYGRKECIFAPFTASHWSFEANSGEEDMLKQYEDLRQNWRSSLSDGISAVA